MVCISLTHRHCMQLEYSLPEAPTTPPHSKIQFLARQIGWLHRPGFSGFPTSKREVSVEKKKHHTRATIAAPKHEKSLFIFDRLPTFNGRVYVLQKQTEAWRARAASTGGFGGELDYRPRWSCGSDGTH